MLKVTVPPAVPPAQLTVAVKVTAWPAGAGFCEEASATLVPAAVTTWVSTAEVAAAQWASPP
jgi:hypothetical protein